MYVVPNCSTQIPIIPTSSTSNRYVSTDVVSNANPSTTTFTPEMFTSDSVPTEVAGFVDGIEKSVAIVSVDTATRASSLPHIQNDI